MRLKRVMIGAPKSGSGKTTIVKSFLKMGSNPFIRTKREKHEFPIIKRIFVLFFLFFALQNIAKQGKNLLKTYAKLTQLTQKLRNF